MFQAVPGYDLDRMLKSLYFKIHLSRKEASVRRLFFASFARKLLSFSFEAAGIIKAKQSLRY
jgi:hypothetical protein